MAEFKNSWMIPIAVALITVLGTIIVALINQGAFPAWSLTSTSTLRQTPSALRTMMPAEPTLSATGISPRFRLVEVFLRADPFEYTGPCPVTIMFTGRISAVGGEGTVSYKWLRSDGASAPVETVNFTTAGSKDLSTTWQLGGAGSEYTGWQSIQILEPQEVSSEQAQFHLKCD